ncbi:RagB/SusD family nutrient uptake outer membrane protein [Sphingobacterium sp. LRF_L2]|uniref:RagB/SusD family nutrient uptake outer membrane protein n=1 Tax=Sphingobacterium sp. LRF_L2 TaxID=3369421 RepID=UPI003F5EEC05
MNIKYNSILLGLTFLLPGCKDFLDEKPLSSLAILETLDDYKAIVQNESRMNSNYPFCYDYASDYFYLSEQDYNAVDETGRNAYTWQNQPAHQNNWSQNYTRIYDANVVLDGIDKADLLSWTESDRAAVKGTAYFFKAFSLLPLALIYAPAYEREHNSGKLGIPLRYSSDINERITRASLEETYLHIEEILLKASALLPSTTKEKTLPTREAAFAALARLYLLTQDYAAAARYADSCLKISEVLIDYNTLNATATTTQFPELNSEVIFHATKGDYSAMLLMSRAQVDSSLYDLYAANDMRKSLFFRKNAAGVMGFYGDYAGNIILTSFSGIARDEVYLILAEAQIRVGDVQDGISTLNRLLAKRIRSSEFVALSTMDQQLALDLVLLERRKELCFRSGLRWMDLKRLNLDESRTTVIRRKLGNTVYELEPNDDRYVFKIPDQVIALSGITQNP